MSPIGSYSSGQAVTYLAEIGGCTGKSSGGPPGSTTIGSGLERVRLVAKGRKLADEVRVTSWNKRVNLSRFQCSDHVGEAPGKGEETRPGMGPRELGTRNANKKQRTRYYERGMRLGSKAAADKTKQGRPASTLLFRGRGGI